MFSIWGIVLWVKVFTSNPLKATKRWIKWKHSFFWCTFLFVWWIFAKCTMAHFPCQFMFRCPGKKFPFVRWIFDYQCRMLNVDDEKWCFNQLIASFIWLANWWYNLSTLTNYFCRCIAKWQNLAGITFQVIAMQVHYQWCVVPKGVSWWFFIVSSWHLSIGLMKCVFSIEKAAKRLADWIEKTLLQWFSFQEWRNVWCGVDVSMPTIMMSWF